MIWIDGKKPAGISMKKLRCDFAIILIRILYVWHKTPYLQYLSKQ